VPETHIRAVRAAISVPLLVGGGLRTGEHAAKALDAGADILVTGTIAENGLFDRLGEVVSEVLKRRTG
ncbi:MAG: geranylgeranylglyceryl/heptaprenylglyceryl phosphate synthase, partial [Thermoplasmatota archaeon]